MINVYKVTEGICQSCAKTAHQKHSSYATELVKIEVTIPELGNISYIYLCTICANLLEWHLKEVRNE